MSNKAFVDELFNCSTVQLQKESVQNPEKHPEISTNPIPIQ